MSSHDLNVERLRHAKVPRHKRLCSCCDKGAREDEMHLLECPAYAEVRGRFSDVFPASDGPVTETYMRAVMNPTTGEGWRRLAEFIICAMAKRTLILETKV